MEGELLRNSVVCDLASFVDFHFSFLIVIIADVFSPSVANDSRLRESSFVTIVFLSSCVDFFSLTCWKHAEVTAAKGAAQ